MSENPISAPYPAVRSSDNNRPAGIMEHRINLAAQSDFALAAMHKAVVKKQNDGAHTVFYYMFKCLILKYFSRKGRASRKEYWSFFLLTSILYSAAFYWFYVVSDDIENLIISWDIIGKALLIPSLTVIIRRVHDFGKSGWWLFVPSYKIIFFAFIKGDGGKNEFGEPE